MQVKLQALKQVVNVPKKAFAGLNLKRKPTKRDLPEYDVLVIGGNLGGIFSRHFDQVAHGHYSMMAIFDNGINQQYPMRTVYEQQRASKTDYLPNSKLAINMYTAHSDNLGVQTYLPDENAVVLTNGRRIGYKYMVIATGLAENVESIKNFEDAWQDVNHPVFACKDHSTWRSNVHKYFRFHYSYTHGDAFFCIPEYPFRGEVGAYNFFLSKTIQDWYSSNGKLSPIHSFTVVNANQRFCQHLDSVDKFFKDQCAKRGIKVEYGQKLVEINKDGQTAVFENVQTKERTTKPYNNLYSLIPAKPHSNLLESGLATKESNYMLDVDHETLQHRKYPNVFGIGDVCNLPTTKTFWGGFHQVHVVRNNLYNFIKGKDLNGIYDGYTKSPIYLGQNKLTYMVHFYNQREGYFNLFDSAGGPISVLRYLYWGKMQKKKFLNYYLFKTWGPPLGKFMKRFSQLPEEKKQEILKRALNNEKKFWPNGRPALLTPHDPHAKH